MVPATPVNTSVRVRRPTPACIRPSVCKACQLKIHQRGVQWKQGVVIHMMLCTTLLCNATPIRCTPLRLHPPVMNTHQHATRKSTFPWRAVPERAVGLVWKLLTQFVDCIYIYIYICLFFCVFSGLGVRVVWKLFAQLVDWPYVPGRVRVPLIDASMRASAK